MRLVKDDKDKDYTQLLDYFIFKLDNVPMFKNVHVEITEDNMVQLKKTSVLSKEWFESHKTDLLEDIEMDTAVSDKYGPQDVYPIFVKYVKLRKVAYNIFCGITSANEIGNAIQQGNTSLDLNKTMGTYQYVAKYCYCDKLTMQSLDMLINTYREYQMPIDSEDEYQQVMDIRELSYRGINEARDPWFSMFYPTETSDRSVIKNINLAPTDANQCKICSNGHDVFATHSFRSGQIIEVCPCREIDKSSLYSHDVRKMAFEVVPNSVFVIPFGYCQYYAIATKNEEPNCSYEWDSKRKVIVIRATKRISKHEKLILLKE